ncbi:MAG: Ldh family oxidoreductase [Firmicutes bacterium]|nr:Ldh family oxidoreductase [Bacillota bacterium]
MVHIGQGELERIIARAFGIRGVPSGDAELAAKVLVAADLQGKSSHGAELVPGYIKRLENGAMEPVTHLGIVSEWKAGLLLDGGNGIGQVIAARAMEICIQRAREHAVAVVGVRNSNHLGALGYYVRMAADQDMVGVAMSNGFRAMAPWGGVDPFFSTNPLAAAIPRSGDDPVVIDMALSATARAKIRQAGGEGCSIPEGWALGPDGKATRDPQEALRGTLLPAGGVKGYALAILVESLCACLTGARMSADVRAWYEDYEGPTELGNLFMAVDVAAFLPAGRFKSRMEEMAAGIKKGARLDGVEEILLPGDGAARKTRVLEQQGIPLPERLWKSLQVMAGESPGTGR